jgi:hypothetical protein
MSNRNRIKPSEKKSTTSISQSWTGQVKITFHWITPFWVLMREIIFKLCEVSLSLCHSGGTWERVTFVAALIRLSEARLLYGDRVLSIRCLWVALVARVGVSGGGVRYCVATFRRKCNHSLGRPLGFWVFLWDGVKLYCGVEDFCLLDSGRGVDAEAGGEEKKLFRRNFH